MIHGQDLYSSYTCTTSNGIHDLKQSKRTVTHTCQRPLVIQAIPPRPTSPLRATQSLQPLVLVIPSRSVSDVEDAFESRNRYPCRIRGLSLDLVELITSASDLASWPVALSARSPRCPASTRSEPSARDTPPKKSVTRTWSSGSGK